ncbi:hypothetical protein PSYPI_19426 [Pseudomonas syringae pv. pisi str. 1704B]|uniref:Uncharacterized protein n=1 Tax=Pseudomonas syringae pv. pisi str. 1704B TaxID=629263 RepID=F3GBI8_PSESJ|nr:hypothetical protein PSYPI_19426 [Pseudomonas syringae pv. pisi str. 1704B]
MIGHATSYSFQQRSVATQQILQGNVEFGVLECKTSFLQTLRPRTLTTEPANTDSSPSNTFRASAGMGMNAGLCRMPARDLAN